ncbi:MAG TPA: DinB family protein [Puia sp.]|nr:DinB family protein [Puia sp.]
MQATIEHLEKIVRVYLRRLEALPVETYEWKPRPEKWSKKEILGHLVDSAQNNIRRLVVAQYEDTPDIPYKQDEWVKCAGYEHYPLKDLIALWNLLNAHMVIVLRRMSPEAAGRKCAMGGQPQTLKWVAADYCNHLLHHLHQILDLDPIAYS